MAFSLWMDDIVFVEQLMRHYYAIFGRIKTITVRWEIRKYEHLWMCELSINRTMTIWRQRRGKSGAQIRQKCVPVGEIFCVLSHCLRELHLTWINMYAGSIDFRKFLALFVELVQRVINVALTRRVESKSLMPCLFPDFFVLTIGRTAEVGP